MLGWCPRQCDVCCHTGRLLCFTSPIQQWLCLFRGILIPLKNATKIYQVFPLQNSLEETFFMKWSAFRQQKILQVAKFVLNHLVWGIRWRVYIGLFSSIEKRFLKTFQNILKHEKKMYLSIKIDLSAVWVNFYIQVYHLFDTHFAQASSQTIHKSIRTMCFSPNYNSFLLNISCELMPSTALD